MKTKVTIIIPIFNCEPFLEKCLDSVINQTFDDLEIICINDGSTDLSLDILSKYAALDRRLLVYSQENAGQSSARNLGLRHASGEYIMFLDGDDWLDYDSVETMLFEAEKEKADSIMCSYIREYPSASLKTSIFGTDRIVVSDNEVETFFWRRLIGPIGKEMSHPEKVDAPISACMQLFSKRMATSSFFPDIKEIGTFEDGLYQIAIYKYCHKFVYINKPFYHYRKTNISSTTSKYKPDLFFKWNKLYEILANEISTKNDSAFYNALNNRICLCFIALSLNEINSNDSFFKRSRKLKSYLKSSIYKQAFKQLKTSYMPLKWKIYFACCKLRFTSFLTFLTLLIKKMKTTKQA